MVRTTGSWAGSFDAVTALSGIGPGSRVWVPGPRTSTMNLFALVHAVAVGAVVARHAAEASHAVLTPAALSSVLDQVAGLTVVTAGDRLTPAAHRRAVAAGATVHHYYGAAELSFVAWGSHQDDLVAFPGVEVVSRDGELWVRSPFLCEGYDGEAGPLRRDAHGFATVGDRGTVDGDRVRVHGRPDAVTTGGATVVVADVEAALREHATGEVVVVAAPHRRLGAVVAAVLSAEADLAGLRAAAAAGLAPAARPRLWFGCPDLPLTAAGKVDRERLAADVTSGRLRRLTPVPWGTP